MNIGNSNWPLCFCWSLLFGFLLCLTLCCLSFLLNVLSSNVLCFSILNRPLEPQMSWVDPLEFLSYPSFHRGCDEQYSKNNKQNNNTKNNNSNNNDNINNNKNDSNDNKNNTNNSSQRTPQVLILMKFPWGLWWVIEKNNNKITTNSTTTTTTTADPSSSYLAEVSTGSVKNNKAFTLPPSLSSAS